MSKVTNSKTRTKDVLLSSPSKQPRKRKEYSQVQERSEWQSSYVDESITINKTNAVKNYHLVNDDLKGVPCQETTTTTKTGFQATMFLYNERTIELIAWEKYGGPEGFEKMLNSKREKWNKKTNRRSKSYFPQPSTYMNISSPIRSSLRAPTARPRTKIQPNFEILSANLLKMKTKMEKEHKLWLWNTLIERYLEWYNQFPEPVPDQQREEIMLSAADLEYPPRPTSPLPETWDGRYLDWDESYFDEVYDALIKVIEEHGTEGWKRARWVVYEKYVECKLGELRPHRTFNEYTADDYFWGDSASFWLYPRDRHNLTKDASSVRRRFYSLLSTVDPKA